MLYLGSNLSTSFQFSAGTSAFLAASSLHREHLALAHMISDGDLMYEFGLHYDPMSWHRPEVSYTSALLLVGTVNTNNMLRTRRYYIAQSPWDRVRAERSELGEAAAQRLAASQRGGAAPRCQEPSLALRPPGRNIM